MEAILRNEAQILDRRQNRFANIKIRVIAFLIDNVIFCSAAGLLLYFFYNDETRFLQEHANPGYLENLKAGIYFLAGHPQLAILLALLHWLYFAVSESSARQASPGKYAVGLKVTCIGCRRITFLHASLRYLFKLISIGLGTIGLWTSLFSEKKQMLHDKITSCLVLKR